MAGRVEVVVGIVHAGLAETDIARPGAVTLDSADVGRWGHNVVEHWTLLECGSGVGADGGLVIGIDWADIEIESALSINAVRSFGTFHFGTLAYTPSSNASLIALAVIVQTAII